METKQMETFQATAKGLLPSGSLSDFTVICAGKQYKVHRAILMCHSVYFKTCFEGKFKEVQEGTIQLKEDPPEAIEVMVHYFYHFAYDGKVSENPNICRNLLHSMVYAVADKYQIPDLKKLARLKFAGCGHSSYGQRAATLAHVFTSTPETDFGLRDICLVSYTVAVAPLQCQVIGTAMEGLKSLFAQVPDLAAELSTFGLLHGAGYLDEKVVVSQFDSVRKTVSQSDNQQEVRERAMLAKTIRYLKLSRHPSRADDLQSISEMWF